MSRPDNARHNFQYVVVDIDEAVTGINRDEIVAALRLENVFARRYFYPGVHRMHPYAGMFPRAGRDLPVTIAVAQRVMILPTGIATSRADAEAVAERIGAIVREAPAVRAALKTCTDERMPPFMDKPAA